MSGDGWVNGIHQGNCLEVLQDLPENHVHAIATDPPYGLAFMGRDWDDFEPREYQTWCENWANRAKRVLKPGGHLLAFSGNRTHHRLFSGVENAGFDIRDTLTWHYGNGFPKGLDVSKAIDDSKGADREVAGTYEWPDGLDRDVETHDTPGDVDYGDYGPQNDRNITDPATSEAEAWDGWKTGLKPATEFIVLARKPLGEDTVAENVLEHGAGALNIDGCRIGAEQRPNRQHDPDERRSDSLINRHRDDPTSSVDSSRYADGTTDEGRYPANLIFDGTESKRLDRGVGECESGDYAGRDATGDSMFLESDDAPDMSNGAYSDRYSGPSRYFYTSKASRSERTLGGLIENAHPTVKPVDLMEWLVKLSTAEGQTVLDPFAGTGTTCRAAKNLSRQFIGIEQQAKWADVARARVGLTPEDPSVLRADDQQTGLDELVATDP